MNPKREGEAPTFVFSLRPPMLRSSEQHFDQHFKPVSSEARITREKSLNSQPARDVFTQQMKQAPTGGITVFPVVMKDPILRWGYTNFLHQCYCPETILCYMAVEVLCKNFHVLSPNERYA